MNIVLIIAILYVVLRMLHKEYRADGSFRDKVIGIVASSAIITSILIAILS